MRISANLEVVPIDMTKLDWRQNEFGPICNRSRNSNRCTAPVEVMEILTTFRRGKETKIHRPLCRVHYFSKYGTGLGVVK